MSENSFPEKRHYVRMNTVFPVQVEAVPAGKIETEVPVFFQAFTDNVSAGGMCLEFLLLERLGQRGLVVEEPLELRLTINAPFLAHPILACARTVWIRKDQAGSPVRCWMGITYTNIDENQRKRLVRYALRRIWLPKLTVILFVLLVGVSLATHLNHERMARHNRQLVLRLIADAQKRSQLADHFRQTRVKHVDMERQYRAAVWQIQQLQTSISQRAASNAQDRAGFIRELREQQGRQAIISEELKKLRLEHQAFKQGLVVNKQNATADRRLMSRQLTGWLQAHQNLKTGLLASFEGDQGLQDKAFTYDQALAAQAMMISGENDRARKILEFYEVKAERKSDLFYNAYDAATGQPAEMTATCGPNLWIGISAAQFAARDARRRMLDLAESVAGPLIGMLDAEGGLPGGTGLTWYSTEHNLDAYALFAALERLTAKPSYAQARLRVLAWLKQYAYSSHGMIRRGKADSTIATDTFSWSIASIGPQTLASMQFDPAEIMDYAREHCEVTVQYRHPSGPAITVRGFDFAKAKNLGRGGVLSTEWTAQMIVAYRVMADYFRATGRTAQADTYRGYEDFYMTELQKMVITSPSRIGQGAGCLPYASADNADTGHGWRTPKGDRTGSVAATAYAIFAAEGYNPLNLDQPKTDRQESKN